MKLLLETPVMDLRRGWAGLAGVLWLAGVVLADGGTRHVSLEPLEGVAAGQQFRTISAAVEEAGPGDTVVVHPGVYRERVVIEASGEAGRPITLAAAPGAFPVVTGADVLDDFTAVDHPAGNVFSVAWPYDFISWNPQRTHPGDERHRLIGRSEQVFVDGYPLRQVLERGQIARGTFCVDLDAKRLYVCTATGSDLRTSRETVEASTRSEVLVSKGDHVRIQGLRFRYAANRAQQGACRIEGDYNTLADCVFEYANSSGATFAGEHIKVENCTFRRNGQLGFGAGRAHHLHMIGCRVEDNNTKNYDRGWEAGGNKLAFCRDVLIERCTFVNNRGDGVWFDIDNEDCTVRNCLIAFNENAGIFYEISYRLHAHDNVIVGNGLADSPGAWGASAGISLSSSPGCVIERNLLVGNKEGFNFREQYRTTPLIDSEKSVAIWNHDQTVRNNVIALNRDVQTAGWFDIEDSRHWPRGMQSDRPAGGGKAPADIAARYQAQSRRGHPVEASLGDLDLRLEANVYAGRAGKPLYQWGTTWRRHEIYDSLDAVRTALGLERGSVSVELPFANVQGLDLRLPAGSAAFRMGAYPRGEPPGCRLGRIE